MAKATKKQALGRGLSALLKDPSNDISSVQDKNADKVIGNIVELDLDTIEINPFQPRTSFNEETLRELAPDLIHIPVYCLLCRSAPGQAPAYPCSADISHLF